jgi:hypothetical protein
MKDPIRTQAILWQQWGCSDDMIAALAVPLPSLPLLPLVMTDEAKRPRSIEDVLTDEDRARIDAERILEEDDENLDIEWDDDEEEKK